MWDHMSIFVEKTDIGILWEFVNNVGSGMPESESDKWQKGFIARNLRLKKPMHNRIGKTELKESLHELNACGDLY